MITHGIALGDGGFNRMLAVRAIHQAFIQIAFANKHLETPPDNAATLAALEECMVDAGHIGFPIPAQHAVNRRPQVGPEHQVATNGAHVGAPGIWLMDTENYCRSLRRLPSEATLRVMQQVRAQLDLNSDPTEFIDNRPAAQALDACIAQGVAGFDRTHAIRAVHMAFLQLRCADKHLDTPPDNSAALASLEACMILAGHPGFPVMPSNSRDQTREHMLGFGQTFAS